MKAFIVDKTYRIIDGKAHLYLFGRLDSGESFLSINKYKPGFYIKQADLEKARKIAKFEQREKLWSTTRGEPVTEVVLEIPKDVPQLRQGFEQQGIACFEADIPFAQRVCMDLGIYATLDIQGEHKKGHYVGRIYEEPTLTPVDYTPRLETLSIDIETSLDGKSLYAIGLAQGKRELTLFLTEHKNPAHAKLRAKDVEVYSDEKSMLERFAQVMQEWDPDIVTGWNVIGFDFNDLKTRFDRHKVPFVLGRAEWPSTLRIESSFMKDSTAEFAGRMVLDGIHLMKSSFVKLEDYKLETAAQHFLGEGKLIKGENRHLEIERLYHEDPAALIAYNLKDAQLVLKILERAQLIELTALRSKITGLTMERVRGSIAAFDSVYIRAMHERGLVAPSGTFGDKPEALKGGYVRDSKPGVYSNIVVLDFKSMYPSVMRTFNIDPVAFWPDCKERHSTADAIVAPNGACFRTGDAILPTLIQQIWLERDSAKRRKDKVASLAFKTLMNSFFGVLASPNCRFFSLEMGNAITGFARLFIKLAAEKIEELGYEVVYGDTDSVFVDPKAASVEAAEKIGHEIERHINSFYRDYVRSEYHRESFMEIQVDKVFRKFLLPRLRGTDVGAKKRYAGLRMIDGKEEMDFTGLEFVRRDWTEAAKAFQMELLDRIFKEQEVTEYVKEFVRAIREGKHDDLLVYRKSVRKELVGYTKTTPPHVKAARILEQKTGKLPSSIIEYVVTRNGPEPIGYLTAPIDYEHYIDKQIKPLADSILGFYGTTFDDLLGGQKQKTLFGY